MQSGWKITEAFREKWAIKKIKDFNPSQNLRLGLYIFIYVAKHGAEGGKVSELYQYIR